MTLGSGPTMVISKALESVEGKRGDEVSGRGNIGRRGSTEK